MGRQTVADINKGVTVKGLVWQRCERRSVFGRHCGHEMLQGVIILSADAAMPQESLTSISKRGSDRAENGSAVVDARLTQDTPVI